MGFFSFVFLRPSIAHFVCAIIAINVLLPSTFAIANDLLFPQPNIQVDRFALQGENPLSAKETDALLANYLGEHQGIEGIEAAANALENALKKAGFPFFRVRVPSQSLKTKVIHLALVRLPLGNIEISGNQYFSLKNILNTVPTLQQKMTSADLQKIQRGLDLANRHRTKQTGLTFTTDEALEQINIRLAVKDENPMALSVFARNTGDKESTGAYRTGITFRHDNVFQRDHGLTATYIMSPTESSNVDQYGGNYRIPFYSIGDELNLSAWQSNAAISSVADNYDLNGTGKLYSARFTHFLSKHKAYQHQIDVSLQDRFFKNDLTLDGTFSTSDVRSRPVAITYKGRLSTQNTDTDFFVDYRKNSSSGTNNNQAAYEQARSGAIQNWSAVTLGANVDYWLPKQWLLRANMDGQLTDHSLISGEQFGFGGATSLPGFAELEVLGDQGYQTKLELMTPRFANRLRFFTSYEVGRVKRQSTLTDQAASERASSIVLGIDRPLGKKCAVKLQAGYVLDGVDDTSEGDSRTQDGDSKTHFAIRCRVL